MKKKTAIGIIGGISALTGLALYAKNQLNKYEEINDDEGLNVFQTLKDQPHDVDVYAQIHPVKGFGQTAFITTHVTGVDDIQFVQNDETDDYYALIKTSTKLENGETNYITYAYSLTNICAEADSDTLLSAEEAKAFLLSRIQVTVNSTETIHHILLIIDLDENTQDTGKFIDDYPVIQDIHHEAICQKSDDDNTDESTKSVEDANVDETVLVK